MEDVNKPTRRDLLKGTAAVGVAAAVDGAVGTPAQARSRRRGEPSKANRRGVLDVAVIGAGAAGAYAAWRLLGPEAGQSRMLRQLQQRRRGRLAVGLFEGSERIGGRLLSVTPPGMPHLRAELGGMRYLDSQPIIPELVKHLGLRSAPFPVDEPQNLAYLRGHRFPLRAFSRPAVVPYHLAPLIRGKSPDDALVAIIQRFVPDAATMDHKPPRSHPRSDGRLLPGLDPGSVWRGIPLLAGGGKDLEDHAADAPPVSRCQPVRLRIGMVNWAGLGIRRARHRGADARRALRPAPSAMAPARGLPRSLASTLPTHLSGHGRRLT